MNSGIILAAGTSSRLGQPKQLLELDGRPMLQYVVDSATEAGLDEIVVVLGHDADRIASALALPGNARIVINDHYERGQSSSLRTGIDALDPRSPAAVILLGDQPGLSPEAIRRAIDAFASASDPIVRTFWRGTPGHPVVVARSHWAALREIIGDRGARDLLSMASHVEIVEMDTPPVADVDTWDQYRQLREGS